MALFKISRGASANLPIERHDGWAYFCTDTAEFFIDYLDENGILQRKSLNANAASELIGYDIVNSFAVGSEIEIPTTKAVIDKLSDSVVLPDNGAIITLAESLLEALPSLADGVKHVIEFTSEEENIADAIQPNIDSSISLHNNDEHAHDDIRESVANMGSSVVAQVNTTLNSYYTSSQVDEKLEVFDDRVVATDDGTLTAELPETFGGRTADEYALKSDLENIGGGGSVSSNCVSWNALIGKATEGNLEKYIYYQNDNEIFENGTSDDIYTTTFSCYELMGASDDMHIGINIDGIDYTDTIGNFKNNDIVNGEYPVSLDIHYEGNGINLVDISYYGNSKPNSIQLYTTYKGMNTIKSEYLPRLSEIMRLPEDESSLNLTLIASAYNSLIDSLTYAGYI